MLNLELSGEFNGESSYVRIGGVDWSSIDSVAYEMLSNNDIPALMTPLMSQKDNEVTLRYETTGLRTLEDLLAKDVTRAQVLNVFNAALDAMDESRDYLLHASSIMLDARYVYVNEDAGVTRFVYVPVTGWECGVTPADFFRSVISGVRASGGAAYIGEVLSFLNSQQFTTASFRKLLVNLGSGAETHAAGPQAAQAAQTGQHSRQPRGAGAAGGGAAPKVYKGAQASGTQRGQSEQGAGAQREPKRYVPPARKQEPAAASAGQASAATPQQAQADVPYPVPGGGSSPAPEAQQKRAKGRGGLFGKRKAEDKGAAKKSSDEKKKGLFGGLFAAGDQQPAKAGDFDFAAPGLGDSPEDVMAQKGRMEQESGSSAARNAVAIDGDFGDTVVGSGSLYDESSPASETVVGASHSAYILRVKDDATYLIGLPEFVMGRSADDADLAFPDNKEISKRHARITYDGARYFIEDLGSLNHTYVDGRQLGTHEKTELEDGMVVRLSGEKLVFSLS